MCTTIDLFLTNWGYQFIWKFAHLPEHRTPQIGCTNKQIMLFNFNDQAVAKILVNVTAVR